MSGAPTVAQACARLDSGSAIDRAR